MTTVEPCQCGGFITADERQPAEGIRAHQQTGRHLAWRGIRYRQCVGVEDVICVVSIPAARRLCHYCKGTLRLLAAAA